MPATPPRFWQSRALPALVLLPLAALFAALVALRRRLYASAVLAPVRLPVPVVVVGNIALGGSGKTPVVQWLVASLRAAGWRPGVVSRGYGGQVRGVSRVSGHDTAARVGDEPLLLSRSCDCPVAIGVDRPAAAALLVEDGCDVIISDDGLQHYRLGRDVEIIVVDARTLGNRLLLPAGPLREPLRRLATADLVIAHGGLDPALRQACAGVPVAQMQLVGDVLLPLHGGAPRPLRDLRGCPVHAFAGIGRPERFFAQLAAAGLAVVPHAFADHHRFVPADFAPSGAAPKILTAKDAVKCEAFALANAWVLPVVADIEAGAAQLILEKLKHGPKAA